MRISPKYFTLLETVIAIAVLALGLVAAMSMSSASKLRMDKSYKRWHNEHMLAQASEFFLLAGANAQLPDDIFPYENVSASCSIEEPEELPDDVDAESGQWKLAAFRIDLTGSEGNKTTSIIVEKIICEEQP